MWTWNRNLPRQSRSAAARPFILQTIWELPVGSDLPPQDRNAFSMVSLREQVGRARALDPERLSPTSRVGRCRLGRTRNEPPNVPGLRADVARDVDDRSRIEGEQLITPEDSGGERRAPGQFLPPMCRAQFSSQSVQTHLGKEEVVATFSRGVNNDSRLISRKGDVLPRAQEGENMNWISNDPSELVHRRQAGPAGYYRPPQRGISAMSAASSRGIQKAE
jgi:hypothetical protein